MPTIRVADKPTLDTVNSNVTTVKKAVQNSTYGLQAIKNAIGGAAAPLAMPRIITTGTSYAGSGTGNIYSATQQCYIQIYLVPKTGEYQVSFSTGYDVSTTCILTMKRSFDYSDIYMQQGVIKWGPLASKCVNADYQNGIVTILMDANTSILGTNTASESVTLYWVAYTFAPA